jgi:DNA invertase Pin-like site-specific DNA recombinase
MQAQNDIESEDFLMATTAHTEEATAAVGRMLGYARVSTSDQELRLQLDALTEHGVSAENIYQEKTSANSKRRPELDKMMRELRAGDMIVAWKPDRLFRSLAGWIKFVKDLEERGAYVRILTQLAFDSSTASGRLITHVLMAIAEFEADLGKERTLAGLRAAKARGRVGGARPRYSDDQIRAAVDLFTAGATWEEVAETVVALHGKRKGDRITPTQLRSRAKKLRLIQ